MPLKFDFLIWKTMFLSTVRSKNGDFEKIALETGTWGPLARILTEDFYSISL
jgi:hypothetical protein